MGGGEAAFDVLVDVEYFDALHAQTEGGRRETADFSPQSDGSPGARVANPGGLLADAVQAPQGQREEEREQADERGEPGERLFPCDLADEALSDRVSIIRTGRIVESGSLADLRHMSRTTVEVDTVRSAEALARMDGVHGYRTEAGRTVFDVDGDQVPPVMSALAPLGVRSLIAHPPTLEQLLMRHYGADLAARGAHPQEVV